MGVRIVTFTYAATFRRGNTVVKTEKFKVHGDTLQDRMWQLDRLCAERARTLGDVRWTYVVSA